MIPKYRAWDRINNRFVIISDFVFDIDGTIKEIGTEFLDFGIDPSFDSMVLMQSTGLKDKNGVEVFEGDIVLENGMQRVITFGEQRYEEDFGNLAYYIGFNIFTKWGYSSIDPVEHEVLGNIYENTELLEGKE